MSDRCPQLTRVSEWLPCLAHSGLFHEYFLSSFSDFFGFLCFLMPTLSRFYRVPALFCLYGFDSFQVVKDLRVKIYCLMLLFSDFDHFFYFLYPESLFPCNSIWLVILLDCS